MKKFKKIMAVLVAAIMVVAMTVPAWADDYNYSYNPVSSGTAYDSSKSDCYFTKAGDVYTAYTYTDDTAFEAAATAGTLYIRSVNETITLHSVADPTLTDQRGTEYKWFKVLTADYGSDITLHTPDPSTGEWSGTAVSPVAYYTTVETIAQKLQTSGLFTYTTTSSTTPTRYYVSLVNDATTGEAIANAMNIDDIKNAIATGNKGTVTATDATGDVTIDVPGKGYYLIVASNGTKVAVQTLGAVEINEKNQYPTVDKTVSLVNGEANTEGNKEHDVSIGDVITYSVPIVIPSTVAQQDIVVTDTITDGLTLNKASLSASDGTNAVEGLAFSGDGSPYTITIPAATVFANKGKTITLTYTATLNASAKMSSDSPGYNSNKVKIAYDAYTTHDVETKTKTHKFVLLKTDTDDEAIKGVKFTLTRTGGDYYQAKNGTNSVWTASANELTTGVDGKIIFDGLDSGTYTLTETAPAPGYHMLTAPIIVTITDGGTVTYTCEDVSVAGNTTDAGTTDTDKLITIQNKAGNELPSTGGMGTTVLYIVGGMLVILAGAYLFFSRKRTA